MATLRFSTPNGLRVPKNMLGHSHGGGRDGSLRGGGNAGGAGTTPATIASTSSSSSSSSSSDTTLFRVMVVLLLSTAGLLLVRRSAWVGTGMMKSEEDNKVPFLTDASLLHERDGDRDPPPPEGKSAGSSRGEAAAASGGGDGGGRDHGGGGGGGGGKDASAAGAGATTGESPRRAGAGGVGARVSSGAEGEHVDTAPTLDSSEPSAATTTTYIDIHDVVDEMQDDAEVVGAKYPVPLAKNETKAADGRDVAAAAAAAAAAAVAAQVAVAADDPFAAAERAAYPTQPVTRTSHRLARERRCWSSTQRTASHKVRRCKLNSVDP